MDCMYLKLDMTHADYVGIISGITNCFHTHFPDNEFSINHNKDNTVAWVKTCEDSGLAAVSAAILDTATYATRQKVIDDVTPESWTGPVVRHP